MAGRRALVSLFAGISTFSVTAALAQDGLVYELDPLIIYGDRSAEKSTDTNSSVTVLGRKDIDKPSIAQWRDVIDRTPNMGDGDLNESGFTIRGVNSEGLTPGGAGAPVAGFYIDGVQQTVEGTRRGFRGTFDVDQVEVYRGPQSTLSGRNALAGAIYLRTKDPEFERSGQVQLTYGENNKRQVGVAFGDALGDTLAYRVSAEWSKKENDIKYPSLVNYARYDDFVTDDYYTVRGKLLWTPAGNKNTRVLFSVSHSYDGPAYRNVIGPGWYPGFPLGITYGDNRGDDWGVLEPFNPGAITYQEVRDTTVDNVGIEITHDFSEYLKFTALTGFTHSVTGRHSINEGTAGEFYWVDGEFDQTILSQELRFNYDDGQLRWVAGAYLARETFDSFRNSYAFGGVTPNSNAGEVTNLAAFGEISYAFAPKWQVVAGARIDHYSQSQTAIVAGTPVSGSSYKETSFIPKVGLIFEPNENHRLSLVYQQGYRPGGAVFQSNPGQLVSYSPEKSHNIELNWKGRFAADRLTVNASVFHQDWRNQQVEIWQDPLDSTTSYIANAGESVSYGAELELSYAATDRLDVFGSVGLLKTEFKTFAIGTTNFAGKPFPLAPEATIGLGFAWSQGEQGWFANGAARFVGKRMSRIENGVAAPSTLKPYTVVDASVGYAFDNGMSLTAYANNLFDEKYKQYEYVAGGQSASSWMGDGREIGVRLDIRF
ncbi:TonB-dependent receptor [Rhodobacteraceae bacterium D3-12]|nr:TonB-dependent receptor [Rhodobacteraceae bacterium D3-12]